MDCLHLQKVDADKLFNLFSNYGNITRIKILHNKPANDPMSLSLMNDPMFGDPFSEVRRMQRDMDRLTSSLLSSEPRQDVFWRPLVDVKETDNQIFIHAEVPGVKKENLKIELKDNVLTISGERKQEKKEQNEKYQRIERSYGNFLRSFAVPPGLKEDQIKANFADGVLEIKFPKAKEEQPKKIAIQ
jgi:HSP20 family protein